MKTCTKCGIEKPFSEFHTRGENRPGQYHSHCKMCKAESGRLWYSKLTDLSKRVLNTSRYRRLNRDKVNAAQNAHTARVKAETIAAYGGSCACCGENELSFLSIDHIFGGGNEERRKLGTSGGKSFYLKLKKAGYPKQDYQVLCHNCNQAKAVHGVCPHQTNVHNLLLVETCA